MFPSSVAPSFRWKPPDYIVPLFKMIIWKVMFIHFGFVELANQLDMVAASFGRLLRRIKLL